MTAGALAGLRQRVAMLDAALARLDEVAAVQARLAAEIAAERAAIAARVARLYPPWQRAPLDRAA
jgi:hypothetical protein